ncbi:hypothetical protein D8676_18350 [Mesorhizobium sp. YM1C-6-2]|nr:hypothetical protein D8676_18350 [Mesorhizobium sp. YM1C-6-2]
MRAASRSIKFSLARGPDFAWFAIGMSGSDVLGGVANVALEVDTKVCVATPISINPPVGPERGL